MKCKLFGREIEIGRSHYDTPWGIFCIICVAKWLRSRISHRDPLEL